MDRRKRMYFEEEEVPEYEEGKTDYTGRQLQLMADEMLREDSRAELCRDCGERGMETGRVESRLQPDITDTEGHPLSLDFPEFRCDKGHSWFKGEGVARGIGGSNPILFEEHLQSRRRREIFPANGVPDPSIVAGLYHRTHPQGRKVNSPEQRRKNGASFTDSWLSELVCMGLFDRDTLKKSEKEKYETLQHLWKNKIHRPIRLTTKMSM